VIRRKDFDQMSTAELAEAERAVRLLDLPVKPIRTRRSRPATHGTRPDPRATLRAARRRAGEIERIERKAPRTRHPDLVALCDISGSMSVYSRMLLRYLHAVTHATDRSWGHVHAFTFGTALTNVTRALRQADPDLALAATGQEASDWEGGTRIGAALERFNKEWSRRVLTSRAVVILITDGLERDDLTLLDREAARLNRSAGRLIWLNPLLRYDGFSPLAGGVRTLLDHVDSFHACHSLDSLQALSGRSTKPASGTPCWRSPARPCDVSPPPSIRLISPRGAIGCQKTTKQGFGEEAQHGSTRSQPDEVARPGSGHCLANAAPRGH
jgi:uncharacterized protein with von Willebrand factor type A (vWA) domain